MLETEYLYMRYIDDVFAEWTHEAENLSEYLDFLYTKHDTIKLTMERSDENRSLHFLDVLTSITPFVGDERASEIVSLARAKLRRGTSNNLCTAPYTN